MDINKDLREIEIAKLAFIGASIAALGDGIQAFAAGLALNALEQDYRIQKNSRIGPDIGSTQRQLDYFIDELIKIKKSVG